SNESEPLDMQLVERLQHIKGNGRLIGSIGRLSPEKGFDLLIRALSVVREKHDDISLVLIGDGPQRNFLEQLADHLGVGSHVHFLGYVQSAGAYTSLFDLYINSSYSEGLPVTILEAMKYRCPVVAT